MKRKIIKELFQPAFVIYIWLPIAGFLTLAAIAGLSAQGKIQQCRHFFPEMSRAACFIVTLPAVNPRKEEP